MTKEDVIKLVRDRYQDGDRIRCLQTHEDFITYKGEETPIVVYGESYEKTKVYMQTDDGRNILVHFPVTREWARVEYKVTADISVKQSPQSQANGMSRRVIDNFITEHKHELDVYDIAQLKRFDLLTDAMSYLMNKQKDEVEDNHSDRNVGIAHSLRFRESEKTKKLVTKSEMPPYTKPTQTRSNMKFKNFKWTEKAKASLEEFIEALEQNGWKALGSTQVPNKKKKTVIVHCIYNEN